MRAVPPGTSGSAARVASSAGVPFAHALMNVPAIACVCATRVTAAVNYAVLLEIDRKVYYKTTTKRGKR